MLFEKSYLKKCLDVVRFNAELVLISDNYDYDQLEALRNALRVLAAECEAK